MKDMEEVHKERTENRINYHISDDISHNFFADGNCNFGEHCYYCNKYSKKSNGQKSFFDERLQKYIDRYGQEAVRRVLDYHAESGASEERILWLLWSYLDIANEIK